MPYSTNVMHQPFSLFAPFSDRIRIDFCARHTNIHSDEDAARFLSVTNVASAQQVHGNTTIVVDQPVKRVAGADGIITRTPNLTLLMRVADCQCFAVYDPTKNMVGALHAGWKGIVTGAIPAFFAVMKEQGSNPADVFVYAGPSLCTRCAEFTDPMKELPGIDAQFFDGRCVDLRGIADKQLRDAGIQSDHMERSPDCTKCKSDIYWTYRGGDKDAVLRGAENILACRLRQTND